MKTIVFKALPFDKTLLTLALESGVDAVLAGADKVEDVRALGRVRVLTPEELPSLALDSKTDEEEAVRRLKAGEQLALAKGWEIIPVENILAQVPDVALEVESLGPGMAGRRHPGARRGRARGPARGGQGAEGHRARGQTVPGHDPLGSGRGHGDSSRRARPTGLAWTPSPC